MLQRRDIRVMTPKLSSEDTAGCRPCDHQTHLPQETPPAPRNVPLSADPPPLPLLVPPHSGPHVHPLPRGSRRSRGRSPPAAPAAASSAAAPIDDWNVAAEVTATAVSSSAADAAPIGY